MPHFSFDRPLGTPGKIAAQLREKFEILMATMVCSGLGMINSGFLGEMLIFCFFFIMLMNFKPCDLQRESCDLERDRAKCNFP